MTRVARQKKVKKPVGEDATPWEEMKAPMVKDEERRESKRAEKKRKRELKKVRSVDGGKGEVLIVDL